MTYLVVSGLVEIRAACEMLIVKYVLLSSIVWIVLGNYVVSMMLL